MTEKEVLEKLDFFKNAIVTLKGENKSLKETINTIELDLKSKEEKRKEEQKTLKETIEILQELKEQIAKSASEKEELLTKIENIEKENGTLKNALESKEDDEKIYSKDDLKDLLQKANEKSKRKIDELTRGMQEYEKELSALKENNSNLEISNKKFEQLLANREQVIESFESQETTRKIGV